MDESQKATESTQGDVRQITFYYDVLSPYAYLAFHQLPQSLQGVSYQVDYKPALLGVLLRAKNMLGPAEVEYKRDWVYRHCLWLASQQGLEMAMPEKHPFNPMPLMRLALACAHPDAPAVSSRHVTGRLLDHVWCGGAAVDDADRMASLTAEMQSHMAERKLPWLAPDSDAVKQQLRTNTEAAVAEGVFGVPTLQVDGRNFWGLDALPMLRAYLDGDSWFASGVWEAAPAVPSGLPPRT
ncbi:2-hydroxychromene-2-carboxylate isomerase [Hydrogenophaga sp. 5NK40-0174]|uniref:2-hydroxychromene-2-carboxylate isomerase n=1 Tax=Hydrogenophaga sp. 5NK40-0174 TaxID=3127649 RepID=UPI00310ABA85